MAETVGIFGAGALGSFLASRLSHARHVVHVLARSPARAEALRRAHPDLRVEPGAEGLAPATLILLCVKSYDTTDAAQALAGARVASAVASLQNGWGHMETLRRALPKSPLLAGATSLGAHFDSHGALHGSAEGSTWFAPWEDTDVRWAEYAAMLFESAGLRAEATRDAPGILWRKLMLNAAVNPVSALFGLRNGEILASKEALRSAEAAASEAARVGVRLGTLDARVDPVARLHEILHDTAENRSSMAEDLARGRRTEIDDIVGAVVRTARDLGEPVPELSRLWDEIRRKEEAGRP